MSQISKNKEEVESILDESKPEKDNDLEYFRLIDINKNDKQLIFFNIQILIVWLQSN